VTNIEDVPSTSLSSLRTIYDDYVLMKEFYYTIIDGLNKGRFAMRNHLLLSKALKSVSIDVSSPTGTNTKVSFMMPLERKESVLTLEF